MLRPRAERSMKRKSWRKAIEMGCSNRRGLQPIQNTGASSLETKSCLQCGHRHKSKEKRRPRKKTRVRTVSGSVQMPPELNWVKYVSFSLRDRKIRVELTIERKNIREEGEGKKVTL